METDDNSAKKKHTIDLEKWFEDIKEYPSPTNPFRKATDKPNKKIGLLGFTEETLNSIGHYLFPFLSDNGKIGFINRYSEIVIEPKYDAYFGHFLNKDSHISVSLNNKWGIINAIGNIVIPLIHKQAQMVGDIVLVRDFNGVGHYALLDLSNNIIVPFNTWEWISWKLSNSGLISVKSHDGEWKKIDMSGNVVSNSSIYNHHSPVYRNDEIDYERERWYAMTDGMYGDYPEVGEIDYDLFGF